MAEQMSNKCYQKVLERSESIERLIQNNSLGYEESLAHVINEY